jgi:hypothetical protein
VADLGLPATVLRPVFFMENFNPQRESILNGTFTSRGLKPDKPLQLIASDDIGAFAALAFANPGDYVGQALELAGDELTEPQIVETLAKVIGRPVTIVPPEGPSPYKDFAKMIDWFNEKGYEADIPALRARYPGRSENRSGSFKHRYLSLHKEAIRNAILSFTKTLVHQGGNESTVGFAPSGLPNPRLCQIPDYANPRLCQIPDYANPRLCQIPDLGAKGRDLGAKGRDLPIPGKQITVDPFRLRCTRACVSSAWRARREQGATISEPTLSVSCRKRPCGNT